MDIYNESIVHFANSRGIPVVADRQSIPADERHFADFVHLTDAGCDAMARRFADFLAEKEIIETLISEASLQQP
jgi:hypothetical protein